MITFEFVPFATKFDSEFARLFASEGYERTRDYLDWAFRSTPGRGWLAVARDDELDHEAVGVLAGIPTVLRIPTGKILALEAVDLVVNPDYRGRGVFTSLGKLFLEGAASAGAQVVWGFPNENAAHVWFKRLNWVRLGPVPYMVRPLRTGFFLGRIASVLKQFDFALGPKLRPVPGLRPIRRFDETADRLWESFARSGICAVHRSASWLNWRIFERPSVEYRTVAVFEADNMLAFTTSTIMARFGGLIHHVLEALCSGPENKSVLLQLLRHEIAHAARAGADASVCWCPPDALNRSVYLRAGFVPLPRIIRPAKTDLGVRPLGDLPSIITCERSWYVSLLDFDAI